MTTTGWRAKFGFSNGARYVPTGSITKVETGTANVARVFSADHRLLAGQEITITNTTHYNGVRYIKEVDANGDWFEIGTTYDGDDTGNWEAVNSNGVTEWRMDFINSQSVEHVGHLLPQYRVAYWRNKDTGAIVTDVT